MFGCWLIFGSGLIVVGACVCFGLCGVGFWLIGDALFAYLLTIVWLLVMLLLLFVIVMCVLMLVWFDFAFLIRFLFSLCVLV